MSIVTMAIIYHSSTGTIDHVAQRAAQAGGKSARWYACGQARELAPAA